MTLDPRTATLDEIRDWFAERDGWTLEPVTQCFWEKVEKDGSIRFGPHPYPPTRDGAASAMPSGYRLTLGEYSDGWYASARHNSVPGKSIVKAEQEADEITARYRLAALAVQAMDAKEAT